VPIRALIVDDEPLARDRVRRLLARDGEVEVVGESRDGPSAVQAVRKLAPDLLFLDVMMPGQDGFDVLDELDDAAPAVIFLTAYDRYAIRAFDACAIDYLLKPFDEDRFAVAVQRAKRALAAPAGVAPVAFPLPLTKGPLRRLVVKTTGGRLRFVKTEDVAWVAAEGNYARVHVAGSDYLLRETLAAFEAQLDARSFVRIHRSTIVNLDHVRELEPLPHGTYAVVLGEGTRLTLSRRFRERFERALGRPLAI
jgi:two-component system LytT family response regulator